MTLHRFVFIGIVLVTVIWIGAMIWNGRQPKPTDISGMHGVMLFLITPAALMAFFERTLKIAAGLVAFSFFILLSVVIAGQISG